MQPFYKRKNQQLPILIKEGYKSYNILRMGNMYYGIAQNEGEFKIKKFKRGKYKRCFESMSFKEIKHLIDQAPVESVPILIENCMGFNIVCYTDKYYGIKQSLGPVDLTTMKKNALEDNCQIGHCVIGDSLDEVKQLIGFILTAESVNAHQNSMEHKSSNIRRIAPSLKTKFIDYGLRYKEIIKRTPLLGSVSKKIYTYLKQSERVE
jgi:hypothetical protein